MGDTRRFTIVANPVIKHDGEKGQDCDYDKLVFSLVNLRSLLPPLLSLTVNKYFPLPKLSKRLS